MVGDPASPALKDAPYFIGAISDPAVNPPYFRGVLQGTLRSSSVPSAERGTVSYFQDGLGYTSAFIGEYKAHY